MPAPCTYVDSGTPLSLVQKVERRIDSVVATGQTPGVNRAGIYGNLVTAGRLLLRAVDDFIVLFATTDGSVAAEAGKVARGTISWIAPIPADFLRFQRVTIDNHDRPIDILEDRNSPLYKIQINPEQANDRGRPFAVLIPDSSAPGKQALEIFPHTDAGDTLTVFDYVPALCPEEMIADLNDPMIWFAAGLTLLDTDQAAKAPEMFQAAAALITNLRIRRSADDAKPFRIGDQGIIQAG